MSFHVQSSSLEGLGSLLQEYRLFKNIRYVLPSVTASARPRRVEGCLIHIVKTLPVRLLYIQVVDLYKLGYHKLWYRSMCTFGPKFQRSSFHRQWRSVEGSLNLQWAHVTATFSSRWRFNEPSTDLHCLWRLDLWKYLGPKVHIEPYENVWYPSL